jgi:CHAT domain-containing protein
VTFQDLIKEPERWQGLVFLNACETGVASTNRGQEAVGMRSAILIRGSSFIVDTHWKVSAAGATPRLAQAFYDHYLKEQRYSAPESLQHAQLSILRQGSYSHPFHWAAYTVTGAQDRD